MLFAVLFAAIGASGWYVYNKGFTKKWRTMVAEELRKQGVEVTLRKLVWIPWRGLIAQRIQVFDTEDRKRPIAEIDHVRLVVNWANLARGKTFIDALDLRDANLSLALDRKKKNSEVLEVSKLSGRLFLPPQQVYLSQLDAEVFGIRVKASGRVVNPQEFDAEAIGFPKKDEEEKKPEKEEGDGLKKLFAELQSLQFEGSQPLLELRFTGDLAQPSSVLVEAAFSAEDVRHRGYLINNLQLVASLRDGAIHVPRITVRDHRGRLDATVRYHLNDRQGKLELRSSLDLQWLAKALEIAPNIHEFVFYEAPIIEVSAEAAPKDDDEKKLHIKASGRLALGRFGYQSMIFERAEANFAWDSPRWGVRGIRVIHEAGELQADVLSVPGDFRARLRSEIIPKIFTPLLSAAQAEWFSQFEFFEAPSINLEVRGPEPKPELLTGHADLVLRRMSYRGVAADKITAKLQYGDRKLVIRPLHVRRPEGEGSGSLTFDFARDEVTLEDIRTTLHPHEVILWIDRKLVKDVAPYRFGRRPPALTLNGVVHTRGGDTTKLRVDIQAPGGMTYTFLRKDLHLPRVEATLRFIAHRLHIADFNGSIWGGRLRGDATISLKPDAPRNDVTLRVENVDFASLTRLYFGYDDSQGKLNANYKFTINGDDARSMTGQGILTVTDGKVFAIPFLGPLSDILNSIVPGMGKDVARRASASFTINRGIIDTRDFLVEGRGFSMIGHGKLMFLDDRMNFDVRINAQGIPGVLLFPVSKLFEYTSTDRLSKPHWRPKLVPRFDSPQR